MKDPENFKELSKKDWHVKGVTSPADAHLMIGCLQRLATAAEKIAFNMEIMGAHSQVNSKLQDDLAKAKRNNKTLRMKLLKVEARELAV